MAVCGFIGQGLIGQKRLSSVEAFSEADFWACAITYNLIKSIFFSILTETLLKKFELYRSFNI